jgi:hypothetical protein
MQHEDVTSKVWQDKCVVLFLSTNSDPQSDGSGTRKTGKGNEELEIACPQAVINYTKHRGGVDVSDQRREYYGVGRSSKNGGNLYYGRKRSLPIGTAFPNLFHTLKKVSGRAKVCALCIEKKKKAPSGRGKQTTYKCKQCDLPLCHVGYFFGIPRCGGAKLGE